jgi:hypothetical protein
MLAGKVLCVVRVLETAKRFTSVKITPTHVLRQASSYHLFHDMSHATISPSRYRTIKQSQKPKMYVVIKLLFPACMY